MENSRFWDELAIQSFQTILKQNPHQAKVHCDLGLAYMRVGKKNKAIRSFLRAVKEDKNFADAYYHLGKAFLDEDKEVEAYRCFKNYTKLTADKSETASAVVANLIEEIQSRKV